LGLRLNPVPVKNWNNSEPAIDKPKLKPPLSMSRSVTASKQLVVISAAFVKKRRHKRLDTFSNNDDRYY